MKGSKKKMSKKLPDKKRDSKKKLDETLHKDLKVVKKDTKREHPAPAAKEITPQVIKSEEETIEITNIAPEDIVHQDIPGEEKEPQPKSTRKIVLNKEDSLLEEKNKVEALLFAYGKYIEESMICELCEIDKRRIRKILEQLRQDYENKYSALTIFQEGTSWKINVREKYLSIVRKIVADTELPKSVMETLAVIAWKSPVYQSEIVRIRGNKCYDHIEVLEEAGFILKDKKGRSYVLKTTDKFYNYFEIDHGNLKSIFEEVKVPVKEEQKTLAEETLIPDAINIKEKIEHIEVKKWTETDEERASQEKFLEEMEGKIRGVQEKNALFEEEMPRLKPEAIIIEETIITEQDPLGMQENKTADEEKTGTQTTEDAPADKKPKSLTKKQLEKKFKDDLLRVRDKMEKK